MALKSFGSDPQSLLPQIVRDRVYGSRFWKEQCFALNAETVLDLAMNLNFVGFTFGGFNRPTQFICLLSKLLQIQPDLEILIAYVDYSGPLVGELAGDSRCDLRYMRALVAIYIRLVATPRTVYTMLEPLLDDYRTLNVLNESGTFSTISMDEWVEMLLSDAHEPIFGFVLPRILPRAVLCSRGDIEAFKSSLDE